MTEEEKKDLLLKDLCGRLPYRVYVEVVDRVGFTHTSELTPEHIQKMWSYKSIKPYLRPMSSMTEEERKIQKGYIYHFSKNSLPDYEGDFVFENEAHEYIDWLNKNMFDFRGLIPKGLALSTEIYNPYVED